MLCVPSGQEVLRVLEHTPVPVVVADQRMPGMSGVELFELLRQNHPHTKRIILTGYIDPSAMLDAINKGQAFYFLTKPWQREHLMTVLIRALEAHRLELANSALTSQLVASQRLAMLGQATARIAHEMSNQLCILPLLEHIEDRYADDSELLQISQFARTVYDRLAMLLGEVKAFVRGESHEQTLLALPLAGALRELVSFLRFDTQIESSRLSLEIKGEPVVLGTKTKIQQVLYNLLKNAAMPSRARRTERSTSCWTPMRVPLC
ncbi:MAG: response regulator [Pirellulaceae bacterium]